MIGAEPGPDGNIYVLHRCFENSCAGRTEPALLKFNPTGKLLKTWGSGMFVFPHGFHVDRDGKTASVEKILEKVRRCKVILETLH